MEWLYEESSQCLAATLAQTYRAGAQREWPLSFQRTLQRTVLDERTAPTPMPRWLRAIIGRADGECELASDEREDNGAALLPAAVDLAVLLRAIEHLPARRQEIFLLRAWEGMNEAEVAALLHCSESHVRGHYRRALQTLRATWRQHE